MYLAPVEIIYELSIQTTTTLRYTSTHLTAFYMFVLIQSRVCKPVPAKSLVKF